MMHDQRNVEKCQNIRIWILCCVAMTSKTVSSCIRYNKRLICSMLVGMQSLFLPFPPYIIPDDTNPEELLPSSGTAL